MSKKTTPSPALDQTIKIEDGIEVPPKHSRGAKYLATASSMKPGDSVFAKLFSPVNSIRKHLTNLNGPKSATIRQVDGGFRVWRLS